MYTNCYVVITSDIESLPEKIRLYEKVGFQAIVLTADITDLDIIKKIKGNLSEIYHGKMDIFFRLQIDCASTSELTQFLKKASLYKDYLISVKSNDKDTLLMAAHDSRVDIISFADYKSLVNLTEGIVSLVYQNDKFIDFSLTESFKYTGNKRSRIFREYYNFFGIIKNKFSVLLYGGKEDTFLYIRGPKEIRFILKAIFGIPLDKGKLILYRNPELLINRLKLRNDPNYLYPGVRIVEDNGD